MATGYYSMNTYIANGSNISQNPLQSGRADASPSGDTWIFDGTMKLAYQTMSSHYATSQFKEVA